MAASACGGRTIEQGDKSFHCFMLVCQKNLENDMQEAVDEYRGYRISVVPVKDCEDRWDFEYRLRRLDGTGEERTRAKSAGGYPTAETACFAAVEVARTEIDNLVALASAKQT
jgi:hypothetical protein